MSAGGVVVLVVGILAINAAAWVLVVVWLRKRMAARAEQLRGRLDQLGERVDVPPERATYRGANQRFSKVKGLGLVALTERHIVFVPALGKSLELSREEITGVREDKWFLRSWTGGRVHLILQLSDGTEVGFFVRDNARWKAALRGSGAGQGAGSM